MTPGTQRKEISIKNTNHSEKLNWVPSGLIHRLIVAIMADINNNRERVPIESRYALKVEEAAEYFRLGQKKIRCLAEDNPTAGLPFRMETDF